jgi:hypothetical protein
MPLSAQKKKNRIVNVRFWRTSNGRDGTEGRMRTWIIRDHFFILQFDFSYFHLGIRRAFLPHRPDVPG